MRHGVAKRKLNKTSTHRIAMLENLAVSLIKNETIKTTLPKAKELRPFVEKIITLGKKNKESSRRSAFSSLRDKAALVKVFNDLSERYRKRNGGYCRIVKAGYRTGDNAPMAYIQLLDQETAKKASK
jgi:large subunit ribosomal protein L17